MNSIALNPSCHDAVELVDDGVDRCSPGTVLVGEVVDEQLVDDEVGRRQPLPERGDRIVRGATAADDDARVLALSDGVARARIVHHRVVGLESVVGLEADDELVLIERCVERRRRRRVQGSALVGGGAERQCVALIPVRAGELGLERAIRRDRFNLRVPATVRLVVARTRDEDLEADAATDIAGAELLVPDHHILLNRSPVVAIGRDRPCAGRLSRSGSRPV